MVAAPDWRYNQLLAFWGVGAIRRRTLEVRSCAPSIPATGVENMTFDVAASRARCLAYRRRILEISQRSVALGHHEHVLRALQTVVDHVHDLQARERWRDVARHALADLEDAPPVG